MLILYVILVPSFPKSNGILCYRFFTPAVGALLFYVGRGRYYGFNICLLSTFSNTVICWMAIWLSLCFVGIDERAMVGVNLLRDKMLLDSVRMNMVVDFCQLAFSRPSKCFLLLFLELLIIADDIEFECRTYPWQTQRQYPYVHMSRHSALLLPVCR